MWLAWIIAGIIAVCVMTVKEGEYGCVTVVVGTIILWIGLAVLALICNIIPSYFLQALFWVGVIIGIYFAVKLYNRYQLNKKKLKKRDRNDDD